MKTANSAKPRNRFAKRNNEAAAIDNTLGDSKSDNDQVDFMEMKIEIPTNPSKSGTSNNPPQTKRAKLSSLMETSLNEGMQKEIDPTNKGFKLLSKFGFQASSGTGLGKHGDGIVAPITVDRDGEGRVGLGVKRELERKVEEIKQQVAHQQENMERTGDQFRERQSSQRKSSHYAHCKRQCERIIAELDDEHDVECHELWPRSLQDADENDNNGSRSDQHFNEVTLDELLKYIRYLRQNYFYCVFCGCRFDSVDDLERNCPGETEEDH